MATKSESFIEQLQGADVKSALTRVMPKTMNYDRFMAMVVGQSKLQIKEHSRLVPSSILVCAYQAASLGLSFDPNLGEAYMVPFNCKIGKDGKGKDIKGTIVTFIPGYRGLIKLCRNAGMKHIEAKVVYEKDKYECNEDENGKHFYFSRYYGKDRGAPRLVFSVAVLKDGTRDIFELPYHKVIEIKNRAAAKTGPWKNFEEEMAMKTGLRRHCKTLEQDTSLSKAAFLDEQMEELGRPNLEVPKDLTDIVDADFLELTENIKKEQLKENTSSKPETTETVPIEPDKKEEPEKKKEPDTGPRTITREEFEAQIASYALQAGQKNTGETNKFIMENSADKYKSVSDIPEDGFSVWLDIFQNEAENAEKK